MELNVNGLVYARYKTGKYVAKIIQLDVNHAIVEILAVLTHPTQGDLHHPNEVSVPLFHQRKALSFHEKARVPLHTCTPFDEDVIPDYEESLKSALKKISSKLKKRDDAWSSESLKQLRDLENDYFKK
ncbi:sporulation phosphorelay system protein KapB [Terrilactibacillus laevilacticus]|uniref:Sporulation phosphorelay system protein KapB n=1 Tax=Terrilactibacillus laevilacticus TaxID=1380157 RepID=A0ABW5PPI2_9BACI|nr:sporulation phosphorelay system protein KapB [Terrilactibacillus laevilacticus]